jgi:hypothetical protein
MLLLQRVATAAISCSLAICAGSSYHDAESDLLYSANEKYINLLHSYQPIESSSSPTFRSHISLSSSWTGYDGTEPRYTPSYAFSKTDTCHFSSCATMYLVNNVVSR